MYYRRFPARTAMAILCLVLGLSLVPAVGAVRPGEPQVTITEYPLPTPDSAPGGITVGPDGALWFHLSKANKIGRIAMDGRVTEYAIPTPNSSQPNQGFVGTGPDGAIWFTENAKGVDQIGRLTMDGRFTEYKLPTPDSFVAAITPGPDGAMWFTEGDAGKVGRITMDGRITEFPLPTPNSRPLGLVAGPDGALWATLGTGTAGAIARITTDGRVTEYPVPTPNPFLLRIAAGPDGALWFAEFLANQIGRITTDGRITEFAIPAAPPLDRPSGQVLTSGPVHLTTGPDGALWFTESNANQIGRLTPDGRFSEYPVPTAGSFPYHPVAGPDGAIWFTELMGNKIGRLSVTTAPGLPNTGDGGGHRWSPPIAVPVVVATFVVLCALLRGRSRRRAA